MIAEGNYGQTEGVFLCSLSFARAKKVRRQPGATGTTAFDCKALSQNASTHLQNEGDSQTDSLISVSEKAQSQTQGLRPLPSPYSFCPHKMSKQKNAPQCLARYAGIRCRKDERWQCENSANASNSSPCWSPLIIRHRLRQQG